MTRKIITSALPYVNNQPHLGNIVGCVLSGDVYTRYCKKRGEKAVYISGTDEYGTAIEMAALSQNKTPAEICEQNRIIHKRIYDWFDIEFDSFGRTTSPSHTAMVQDFFTKIYKNGFFTEKSVDQFYCLTCKIFLADRFVVGTCCFCNFVGAKGDQCDGCGHTYKSTELLEAQCALCGGKPRIESTNHLFFSFDNVKNDLLALYNKASDTWSANSKHITKTWLEQDLHPRCMTRDLKYLWGVHVPLKNFEKKVFYVWFDAVFGYFTFLKDCVKDEYETWIKEGELIQFMGKDNVFFHSIVLPSFIYATKENLPVVSRIDATEFLLFENKKFSKSNGHGIFGLDLIDNKLGKSCLWRYYLIKIRPETSDSSFSFKHFVDTIEADLNNNIGNLCNRVLKYIRNKCNRQVKVGRLSDIDNKLQTKVNDLLKEYYDLLDNIKLRDGLAKVLEISRVGNEYVQQVVQSKNGIPHGFSVSFSIIYLLSHLSEPFMPVSSEKLMKMCNVSDKSYALKFEIIMEHTISEDINPLFNKLDESILEKIKEFTN